MESNGLASSATAIASVTTKDDDFKFNGTSTNSEDHQHILQTVVERNESASSSGKQAHEISEEWSVPLAFPLHTELENRESATTKLTSAKRTVSWADIESGAALTTVKEFQPDPPRPDSPTSDANYDHWHEGHSSRMCSCVIL